MATLTSISLGDVVTVRIYKYLFGRQDLKWANTYEAISTTGVAEGPEEAVRDLAQSIADWERSFHLADVRYDRAIVSTYQPDGEPYNPLSFASIGLNAAQGGKDVLLPMSLQNCLFVRREVNFGRVGRALYRRCLNEADVESPGGDPQLSAAAINALNTGIGNGQDGNSLVIELGLAGWQLCLAKGATTGGAPNSIRRVQGMTLGGVTVKPYNNRYFDRVVN